DAVAGHYGGCRCPSQSRGATEHVAGVDDFETAVATYRAAVCDDRRQRSRSGRGRGWWGEIGGMGNKEPGKGNAPIRRLSNRRAGAWQAQLAPGRSLGHRWKEGSMPDRAKVTPTVPEWLRELFPSPVK